MSTSDPLLNGVRIGFYCIAAVVLGAIGSSVTTLTPKVGKALDDVHAIELNTTRTEAELSGLLNVTRQVAIAERKASDAQVKQIAAIGAGTAELIKHADVVLTDVDLTITGAGVDEIRLAALLDQTTESVKSLTEHSSNVLDKAAQDLDAVDTTAAMANIVTATENVQHATADVASSMATVRKGIEFEVRTLMTPPRKIKWLAEESAHLLGRFFGF